MFRFEIIVRITEERFGRGNKFRVRIAQPQDGALIGWRGHGIHVGIVRKSGVRMIVVERDLIDLLQKPFINLRHVGARQRFRLCCGSCRACQWNQHAKKQRLRQTYRTSPHPTLSAVSPLYRATAARQREDTLSMRSSASSSRLRALTKENRK